MEELERMNDCAHMVTDNRIGPNFGKPLVHRECSTTLAAAIARAEAAEAERDVLRAVADRMADAIDTYWGIHEPCVVACEHESCEMMRALATYRALRLSGCALGRGKDA
jgi:hypothetical protein